MSRFGTSEFSQPLGLRVNTEQKSSTTALPSARMPPPSETQQIDDFLRAKASREGKPPPQQIAWVSPSSSLDNLLVAATPKATPAPQAVSPPGGRGCWFLCRTEFSAILLLFRCRFFLFWNFFVFLLFLLSLYFYGNNYSSYKDFPLYGRAYQGGLALHILGWIFHLFCLLYLGCRNNYPLNGNSLDDSIINYSNNQIHHRLVNFLYGNGFLFCFIAFFLYLPAQIEFGIREDGNFRALACHAVGLGLFFLLFHYIGYQNTQQAREYWLSRSVERLQQEKSLQIIENAKSVLNNREKFWQREIVKIQEEIMGKKAEEEKQAEQRATLGNTINFPLQASGARVLPPLDRSKTLGIMKIPDLRAAPSPADAEIARLQRLNAEQKENSTRIIEKMRAEMEIHCRMREEAEKKLSNFIEERKIAAKKAFEAGDGKSNEGNSAREKIMEKEFNEKIAAIKKENEEHEKARRVAEQKLMIFEKAPPIGLDDSLNPCCAAWKKKLDETQALVTRILEARQKEADIKKIQAEKIAARPAEDSPPSLAVLTSELLQLDGEISRWEAQKKLGE